MPIQTARLMLIAANALLAGAEIDDRALFAKLLGATIPAEWPLAQLADALPFFADALAADPSREGWMNWYALAKEGQGMTLVASVGFLGKRDADGAVEMGYSVLPAYQRRGYATEMVDALATWALAQPGVRRIVAHAHRGNKPSQRVLRGADFAFVGDATDAPDSDLADHLRFERWRDSPVLTAKPIYLSSIPADAKEVAKDGARQVNYFIGSDKVGYRYFKSDSVLTDERAYRGVHPYKHAYTWHSSGAMHSCETFDAEGVPHGTAYQWADDGRLIGSYTLVHGTGVDLWWTPWDDGTAQLSEIHMMRDGARHGYEWWLDENEVPYSERHWQNFAEHGIEREWNSAGRLRRGYPRYWLHGQRVRKDRYVRAAAKDDTLPPFRAEENLPARQFPPEVEARRRLHSQHSPESVSKHG